MDDVTAILGAELCAFQSNTCSIFSTRELKQEAEGCYWCQAWTRTLNGQSSRDNLQPTGACHKKTLNLQTYKLHTLGDYTETIRWYGTMDSYSIQLVHCFPNWYLYLSFWHWFFVGRAWAFGKSRFTRMSWKAYIWQLTQIEWHQVCICQIHSCISPVLCKKLPKAPEEHHVIWKSHNYPEDLEALPDSIQRIQQPRLVFYHPYHK